MVFLFCLVSNMSDLSRTWRYIYPRMPRSVCIVSWCVYRAAARNSRQTIMSFCGAVIDFCLYFFLSIFNEIILAGKKIEEVVNMWTSQTDIVCHNSLRRVKSSKSTSLIRISDTIVRYY